MARKATTVKLSEPVAPPAPLTEAEYFEHVVDMMRHRLLRAQENLAHFRAKLDSLPESPGYALESSGHVFEAAGDVDAFGGMLKAIDAPDSKVTLRSMRDYALAQVLRAASNGSSSTSPVQNYMDRCRGGSWTKLFEMTDGMLRGAK
jgi:hypothetical protein